MKINIQDRPILRDLGNGLVLCRTRADDGDALAEFNARIHSDEGLDKPDLAVAAWTRDLLTKPHPTFHPDDCTIVAEASSGKIISSMNLISQTWAYEGIPFKLGRPELVGTLPEYRNRGLVRIQFDEVHRWSAERGEQVQAITGIPYYYRLFDYEMCLELGGARQGFEAQLPKLKDGEAESFSFRPAIETDIPFIMDVYARACARRLITCVRDAAIWRYGLSGQDAHNVERMEFRIITRSATGEPVGYLAHPWYNMDTGMAARALELKPGVSWLEVTPAVMRYLWQTGATYKKYNGVEINRTTFGFRFGTEHPVYQVFRDLLPKKRDPYAFFMRVPDLPRFLRTIAPAMEQHIVASNITGYSGTVKIGFYRSGIQLMFKDGKMTTVEPWQPGAHAFGDAAFPGLTFLDLLFGYRDLDELRYAFPDCYTENDEVRMLLTTLFPKKSSDVFFVD
jgi:hypothetical protein